ncbi:MAG TPA: sialidase family protein [Blastocatellia bacterium]|nr:sialidase family protein [Blastocatellia bacterium]
MKRQTAFIFLLVTLIALIVPGVPKIEAQIPTTVGATRAPMLGIDKSDNLYITMSVATKPPSAGTPGSQIFFTMSTDRGLTWDNLPKTRRLSFTDGEAFGPAIAVSNRGKKPIYITYHDNETGPTQVYMVRSKKKTKFKKARNITPYEGGAFSPRIALDSTDAVNIVWGDTRNNGRQVVFVRSTDFGETFSEPLNVSRSPGLAFDADIAVGADDAINVVWEDTAPGVSAIMFARSTDHGQTFSEPVQVSPASHSATQTRITVDAGGALHIVWIGESEGDSNIFHTRSSDGGQTFSEPVNVSNTGRGRMYKPYITTFQDEVYIAYNDQASHSRQVFVVKSKDGGNTFMEPVQVSNANREKGRAHSASMIVDSRGTLHIVWVDSSIVGNDEALMYYTNSPNGRSFPPGRFIFATL